MTTVNYEELYGKNSNIKTAKKTKKKKNGKNKKRKSDFFSYLYLFAFVFLGALWGLSYIIKSYSPEIDVTIGNNEAFTLNDSDIDMEIRTIDERLKWIQMEDDLPSVSVRTADKAEKEKEKRQIKQDKNDKEIIIKENDIKDTRKKIKEELDIKLPMPDIAEIKSITKNEFKKIPAKEVIPIPKPVITKVYLGNYVSLEEAVAVQNKISAIEPELSPFVKSVKGHYIVQLGSFSDSSRAGALAEKLTAKGYYPKINYEN